MRAEELIRTYNLFLSHRLKGSPSLPPAAHVRLLYLQVRPHFSPGQQTSFSFSSLCLKAQPFLSVLLTPSSLTLEVSKEEVLI